MPPDAIPQENTTSFHSILAGNALSESSHEEASDKPKLRHSLWNNWPVFFKNFNVIRDNDRLRNCLDYRRPESLTTKCNTWSWTVFFIGMGKNCHEGQYWDNWQNNTAHTNVDISELITVLWLHKRISLFSLNIHWSIQG